MNCLTPPSHAELVERFGSPLFVYDGEAIERRAEELRWALPAGVDIHYAVKANPSLGILALLRSLGMGAEIASVGELHAVLRAGFEPHQVLYAGPGKRDSDLAAAVEAGIQAIHVESEGELRRLDALGRCLGTPIRAGLRIHVPWTAGEEHRIIGGGEATKFGISRDLALAQLPEWLTLPGVRLEGLHVFNASNVLDADALLGGFEQTFTLARELVEGGMGLEWVDVGGGLGVSYDDESDALDVQRLGDGLGDLLAELRADVRLPVRLVLEPGRYLVAQAGTYLTTVVEQKSCGSVDFLLVDGGVHHLLRPALVGQPHPIRVAGGGRLVSAGEERRSYRVAGPLCTSLDDFGEHLLPPVDNGDLLAIGAAGAYGFTEAMPAFLSHAVPAEVLTWRGEAHLLRNRKEPEEHLEGQHVPALLDLALGGDGVLGGAQ